MRSVQTPAAGLPSKRLSPAASCGRIVPVAGPGPALKTGVAESESKTTWSMSARAETVRRVEQHHGLAGVDELDREVAEVAVTQVRDVGVDVGDRAAGGTTKVASVTAAGPPPGRSAIGTTVREDGIIDTVVVRSNVPSGEVTATVSGTFAAQLAGIRADERVGVGGRPPLAQQRPGRAPVLDRRRRGGERPGHAGQVGQARGVHGRGDLDALAGLEAAVVVAARVRRRAPPAPARRARSTAR